MPQMKCRSCAFLSVLVRGSVLDWQRMKEMDIVCKATADTFIRLGIMILAFIGFAAYFFYDGAYGYRAENEAICSYKAFARLGGEVGKCPTAGIWREQWAGKPLIEARRDGQDWFAVDGNGMRYPLPDDCEAARSFPAEALDYEAMEKGWSDCWETYSRRMHFPVKPGEHLHDEGAIREQWIAGSVFALVGLILLALAIRTSRRSLSLKGGIVTAAGQTFPLQDVVQIDLRQWGPGFKGVAWFLVGGRRIRVDGMTYGGFNKEKGEPAEQFMQAVLSRYQGEIVEYESPAAEEPKA